MSTKIYNGMISDCALEDTHAKLIELKDEMRQIALAGTHAWLANHACYILDRMAMSDRPLTPVVAQQRSVYSEIRDKLDHAYSEIKKGYRQPGIDFDSEVLLFPMNKRTLIFPLIESEEQLKLLQSQSWRSEYGYWDNSDGPKDVSHAAFKKRGKAWDDAMGPTGVPAERGLTFQISSNFDVQLRFTLEGIIAAMPSIDKRIDRYVDDAVITEKINELSKILPSEEWEDLKTRPYSMIVRARELLASDEGKSQRLAMEEKARKRLRDYTIEDLRAKSQGAHNKSKGRQP